MTLVYSGSGLNPFSNTVLTPPSGYRIGFLVFVRNSHKGEDDHGRPTHLQIECKSNVVYDVRFWLTLGQV